MIAEWAARREGREMEDVGRALRGLEPHHGGPLARRVLSLARDNKRLSDAWVAAAEEAMAARGEAAALRRENERLRGLLAAAGACKECKECMECKEAR